MQGECQSCSKSHVVRPRGRAYLGYPLFWGCRALKPQLHGSRELHCTQSVGVGLGLDEEHVDPHSYGSADKALQP